MTQTSGQGLGQRFWALWAAFSASNLGDGLSLVAFPLLAINLTDDARLVALVSAARFLPFLVVGLPAGVVLDRFDRRVMAMLAQVGRAAALGFLAFALIDGSATIPLTLVVAFVVGVGEVLTDGGLPALVREVVQPAQLEVANSRFSATQTVTNTFIGPPVGALLFGIDPAIPFAGVAVLYLASILMLARVPGRFRPDPDETADEAAQTFPQQMMVGLRYVWAHPVLRPLALTVAAFAFVGEAGNAVHVILVTERFGLSELGFGLIVAVDGIASIIMAFFVAPLVARTSHTFSMRVAVVTFTAAALILGFTTSLVSLVVAALLGGISDPSWNVVSGTIRQRLVPDVVFGRMMTAYLFIAWSAQPLGAFIGGVIAEQWGPQWVFVMSGTVVGSLLVLARPMFRAVDTAMAGEVRDGVGHRHLET